MASKRTKWVVFGMIAALVVIGLWVAAFAVVAGGGGPAASGGYDEEVVTEGAGKQKIAVVPVSGEIISGSSECSDAAAVDGQIVAELDQAKDDDDVAAVILDLDTPGGGVVASDNIHRKVMEVRHEGKPVVALMESTAASGGYYIAAAADQIVANPTTLTGSIGVIMVVPNLEKTAEKIGLTTEVIKSGPHKDIASPFKQLADDERKILQVLIDEAYGQFVEVVARGRKMDEAKVRTIADGRVYSGKQARDLGLVDELGGTEVALGIAKRLAKAPDATTVRYSCSAGLSGLFSPFQQKVPDLVRKELGVEVRPGLKYLWLG